jgi:hypothetical protein
MALSKKEIAYGIVLAAGIALTLASLAVVMCGIFCPPMLAAAAPVFFKMAAGLFAALAAAMVVLEYTYPKSRSTQNPVIQPRTI